MITGATYKARRIELSRLLGSGIALLPGNDDSPINYRANTYPFRQDSTFLYYTGLDAPGFSAVIDIDNNREILFGNDFTIEDLIWMGPSETVRNRADRSLFAEHLPSSELASMLRTAITHGRTVHTLPTYRPAQREALTGLMDTRHALLPSPDFIKAVIRQRTIKSDDEVAEIETALAISYDMYELAFKRTRPGVYEYEIAGAIEGLRGAKNSQASFSPVVTIRGEVLHRYDQSSKMKKGDLLVIDSGAESPLHYASDITRTIPVGGRFTPLQRDIYQLVLSAKTAAIAAMKPGVTYKSVHLLAARVIADGLKQLGFMRGDMNDAVTQGAHALFFPHGLGHLLGLDVHDMESLGENNTGYDASLSRSDQFGLAYLRFAKALEPGIVLTVEPGIYFMPELCGLWKSQSKFSEFINFDLVEKNLGFGGIRIEDDVLVTQTGSRILGKRIPESVAEVEERCGAAR